MANITEHEGLPYVTQGRRS